MSESASYHFRLARYYMVNHSAIPNPAIEVLTRDLCRHFEEMGFKPETEEQLKLFDDAMATLCLPNNKTTFDANDERCSEIDEFLKKNVHRGKLGSCKVVEMRRIIPKLRMAIEPAEFGSTIKKEHGLWLRPPPGWLAAEPCFDPNNKHPETNKKATKGQLKQLLQRLIEYYMEIREVDNSHSNNNDCGFTLMPSASLSCSLQVSNSEQFSELQSCDEQQHFDLGLVEGVLTEATSSCPQDLETDEVLQFEDNNFGKDSASSLVIMKPATLESNHHYLTEPCCSDHVGVSVPVQDGLTQNYVDYAEFIKNADDANSDKINQLLGNNRQINELVEWSAIDESKHEVEEILQGIEAEQSGTGALHGEVYESPSLIKSESLTIEDATRGRAANKTDVGVFDSASFERKRQHSVEDGDTTKRPHKDNDADGQWSMSPG